METPSSSIRKVKRSQPKASINTIPMSRKKEESDKVHKSALVDITNDSPIGGLATETPLSHFKKLEQSRMMTPGSGEALLRYQVKTLLQKVDEEAEISKLDYGCRPNLQVLQGFVNSPSRVLAPTPANTPQVHNLSVNGDFNVNLVDGFFSETQSQEESSKIEKMVVQEAKEETLESQKSLITRLLFDLSDKSENFDSSSFICSSELTYQEMSQEKKSMEEDDASVWSIQVNASTLDEDEEIEDPQEEDYGEEEGGILDELCEGLSKINVQEKKIAEFEGKHTRFIYNSDDEIEGEEEILPASPSILRLKGIPTPAGKHLRFADE